MREFPLGLYGWDLKACLKFTCNCVPAGTLRGGDKNAAKHWGEFADKKHTLVSWSCCDIHAGKTAANNKKNTGREATDMILEELQDYLSMLLL